MSTLTGLLQHKVKKSSKKPLRWLRKATFSERAVYHGPFGERDVLPCDFHSSGGSLKLIEKYMSDLIDPNLDKEDDGSVLPKKKLAELREEARRFIQKSTNCSENHLVLFTEGNGFVDVFVAYMSALDVPCLCAQSRRPPVILIGHDMWRTLHLEARKLGAEASEIQVEANGRYDLKRMETLLKFFKKQERVMVGVFSVGDDVTGILNDIQQVTAMLHSYGALAVWDYSSAGAFTKIDMCPLVSYGGLTFKDAAYIKCHQFLGGHGASGVFITNSNVLSNPMFEAGIDGILAFSCVEGSLDRRISPHAAGLSREQRRRLVEGPLRSKAAFELKGYFGDCYLQKRTLEVSELLARGLHRHQGIHIIGGRDNDAALPYLSLLFFHPHTEWALHHGFVVALLKDLFGIQTLPHVISAEHLPSTPELESQRTMHGILSEDQETQFARERVMQVGCVHFSLMYFMRDVDLDFLASAITMVASDGWRLLPFYRFNVVTGKWALLHNMMNKTERLSNTMAVIRAVQNSTLSSQYRHASYLDRARKILRSITDKTVRKTFKSGDVPQGDEGLSEEAQKLRWFITPYDAVDLLDEASPLRISRATGERIRYRSWPGAARNTSPMSYRPQQYSYQRRYGH